MTVLSVSVDLQISFSRELYVLIQYDNCLLSQDAKKKKKKYMWFFGVDEQNTFLNKKLKTLRSRFKIQDDIKSRLISKLEIQWEDVTWHSIVQNPKEIQSSNLIPISN